MGSVKDLKIIQKPTAERPGQGVFMFSDRYSVFDWGEMPNQIPHKGEALCLMGAYFFERLHTLGMKTHYLGLVDGDRTVTLRDLKKPVAGMAVKLVRVVRPEVKDGRFDYSIFKRERGNFLIPLEVIFRNALPEGSSVFRRLKDGSLTLSDIGMSSAPTPGMTLKKPLLDVSTKLETTDRYMSWKEAQEISGLSDGELTAMQKATLQIDDLITREVERMGLTHEDGKVEFGFDENRELMLLDILGTPDECRFMLDGMPVSKEVARVFYRKTPWYNDIEAAKKKDVMRWKEVVASRPPALPPRLLELISLLYQSCCNGVTGQQWFDAPPLADIVQELKRLL